MVLELKKLWHKHGDLLLTSHSALEVESLLARRQGGNGKVLKLLQDITTRWWSTFTMLERLMELKPTLQAMKLMEETSVELSPEMWEIIRLDSIVLKPFKAVQLMMEGEMYITLSIVPILVKGLRDGLREKLSGMKEEVGADPEITASAREKVLETLDVMLADFNSRCGDDESNQLTYQIGHRNRPIGVHRFAVVAHVLDPRFKRLRIIHPDRKANVWKLLEEETVKLIEGKEHQRTQESEGGFWTICFSASSINIFFT